MGPVMQTPPGLPLLRAGSDAPRAVSWAATVGFVGGGLLVLWSAYIHFHLWTRPTATGTSRSSVPSSCSSRSAVSWSAMAVVAVRRVWAAICGIGYAISTLVGFLLTVELANGLFNFKETWAAPFADQALGR